MAWRASYVVLGQDRTEQGRVGQGREEGHEEINITRSKIRVDTYMWRNKIMTQAKTT